jgi:hydroxylamine dehydrogenase
MKKWRTVIVAVAIATLGTALVWMVQGSRPTTATERRTGEAVSASGECAECHARVTPAIVKQHIDSKHESKDVTCFDCHQATPEMDTSRTFDHRGYSITRDVTSGQCRRCHEDQYRQFARSRHGAPAWAAVHGARDFTAEQIEYAELYHPGTINRPANALAEQEGPAAQVSGCEVCHSVGRPNHDGSIGKCSTCHSRHEFSIASARMPGTCGSCHMGPDHSQIEIWTESKHGVVFNARRDKQDLTVPPDELTAWDMDAPTCATCHISGLGNSPVTHNVGDRLTYYLFAAVSKQRPGYQANKDRMKDICLNCHATSLVDRHYVEAEAVVNATNDKISFTKAVYDSLKNEGLLQPGKFDETADYLLFDLWHYFGRTAKHGAYMGGGDFVQWHGNYEIELKTTELLELAEELRGRAGRGH